LAVCLSLDKSGDQFRMHGLVEGVQAIGPVEGEDAIPVPPLREDEIILH
jgi:hypothetical protein